MRLPVYNLSLHAHEGMREVKSDLNYFNHRFTVQVLDRWVLTD